MSHHTESENQAILQEFKNAVNMSAKELETWLKTGESQSVGAKDDESDESTGHQSGRRTVEVLHKHKADYTEDDYNHMQRVVSYVHRHLAQEPSGDIEHSRWRYSLKNWGHDPIKSYTLRHDGEARNVR
jgi:DNA topoisomerase VI subunit B